MRLAALTALFAAFASAASAGAISFAEGWREQRLSLFSANEFSFGPELRMVSDGAVSLAWTRVAEAVRGSTGASWRWTVEQSVPATDLGRRGGDDRNLSLYFVFAPEQAAEALEGAGIRGLLGAREVRVIQYAWGGDHEVGQIMPSPYGPPGQGVTIPLRPAGPGAHSERVDLAADYARAFGGEKGALIGLAVSGDSDDTRSVIRAAIRDLRLH